MPRGSNGARRSARTIKIQHSALHELVPCLAGLLYLIRVFARLAESTAIALAFLA